MDKSNNKPHSEKKIKPTHLKASIKKFNFHKEQLKTCLSKSLTIQTFRKWLNNTYQNNF